MWLVDPVGENLEGAPVPDAMRGEWLRWLKGRLYYAGLCATPY